MWSAGPLEAIGHKKNTDSRKQQNFKLDPEKHQKDF